MFIIVVFCGLYAFFIEPNRLNITTYEYNTNKINDDIKIAFLSDFHTGSPFNNLKRLEYIIDKTNALNPDIILLGGDYVVYDVVLGKHIQIEDILKILQKLKAPLGVYAVLGNHDYWEYDFKTLKQSFEDNNISLLINENIEFKNFNLIGIDDACTYHHNIEKSFVAINENKLDIILTHSPEAFPEVNAQSVMLAGHVHGGQIKLPIIGVLSTATRLGKEYVSGRYDKNNKTLFLSKGLGTSILPLRFMATPEIIILTLKKK